MDVKAAGRSPTNCWCVRVLRVGVVRCGEQWLMHWLAPFATDVNLHVKELRAIEVLFLSASLAPSTANLVGWELSCSLLLSMFDRSTTSARLPQQSDEQLCNSDLRCEEQEDQQCDFVEKDEEKIVRIHYSEVVFSGT